MLSLRNRFGIPGVISVIALVFAMLGGAYAASNNGGGKATASAKAKRGPRGPKGPAGPAGPVGPAGPAGAAGAKGDNGANGATGTAGANGASVAGSTEPPGLHCEEGGSKFVAGATTTYACNGAEGAPGTPGEPWTAGGTLPPGETETGTWAANGVQTPTEKKPKVFVPISFSIPLAAPLDAAHIHYVKTPGGSCTGSAANPTADPGHLCVYRGQENKAESLEEFYRPDFTDYGATTAGTVAVFKVIAITEAEAEAFGTWAVTAPEP